MKWDKLLTKDFLQEQYITLNKSINIIGKENNLNKVIVYNYLKKYDIKKSKDLVTQRNMARRMSTELRRLKRKAKREKWAEKYPNYQRDYMRNYRIKNKERLNELDKKRYNIQKIDPEFRKRQTRSHSKWEKTHKGKVNANAKKYWDKRRKVDPKLRAEKLIRSGYNKALRKFFKIGRTFNKSKYGINYWAIIEHLKPFPENLKDYEIHHIQPLSCFDLRDLEQIKLAFAPENHMWVTKEQHKQIHRYRNKKQ